MRCEGRRNTIPGEAQGLFRPAETSLEDDKNTPEPRGSRRQGVGGGDCMGGGAPCRGRSWGGQVGRPPPQCLFSLPPAVLGIDHCQVEPACNTHMHVNN